MRVEALVPSYVRYVPAGGRTSRDVLAATPVAVDLTVAPGRGPEQIGSVPCVHRGGITELAALGAGATHEIPVVVHGGLPYVPLTYVDAHYDPAALPLANLLGWLRGPLTYPAGGRGDALSRLFSGTPLQDLAGYASMQGHPDGRRGVTLDVDGQRRLDFDGREAAAAAARAYLAAEILVAPNAARNQVWTRFRPALHRATAPRDRVALMQGRVDPVWDARPCVSVAEALGGGWPHLGPLAPPDADLVRALGALHPSLALDGPDPVHGLACAAGSATRWLNSAARDRLGDPAETRRRSEALAPHQMRLRTGTLPARDLPEAYEATRAAVAYVGDATAPRSSHLERVARAAAVLAGPVAALVARASAPTPDDADAIAGLAPRR